MALVYAGVRVELREVLLKDKPEAMLRASAKGTVPVLVLPDGQVIDESLEVMEWALALRDSQTWINSSRYSDDQSWIEENDSSFKHWLDRYKYANRFPEHTEEYYREQAEVFVGRLESALQRHPWLCGENPGFADIAVFPFVRQFSGVQPAWFAQSPYIAVRAWLGRLLECEYFSRCMHKQPPWKPGDAPLFFPPHE